METEAPEKGFPVYYVLDGLSYYEFVRDGVRLQHKNAMKTGIEAAIVVGICHKEEEMRAKRFLEFTGPSDNLAIPKHAIGIIPEQYGGSEQFLAYIEKELKIRIKKECNINPQEETLFGHSLGGYFALWCLFNHPNAFKNYLAISPSIWWNDKELITMCQNFLQNKEKTSPNNVFIAVGEKEDFMVEDAKEVFDYLKAHNFSTDYYVAPNENHASVVPTVMSHALRFATIKND